MTGVQTGLVSPVYNIGNLISPVTIQIAFIFEIRQSQ
jgi:hypothetical protein